MEVNCEGCAGCCIDWRAVAPASLDHERRGPRPPLDDAYNLVPLGVDEVRGFLGAGLADAMTPRLWRADGPGVAVDGVDLAAIEGGPVFFVGLRKPPKPVAPFGSGSTWLPTCVFLDPATLQCRIHGDDRYPDECAAYPGYNLALDRETECERVEAAYGGDRLLDATPTEGTPLLGPQAVGAKLFVHPDPGRLGGVVERIAAGEPTPADRAEFVACAAASRPGSTEIDEARYERAYDRALDADSWVGRAVDDWTARAGDTGTPAPDPEVAAAVEDRRGAPATPGWGAESQR